MRKKVTIAGVVEHARVRFSQLSGQKKVMGGGGGGTSFYDRVYIQLQNRSIIATSWFLVNFNEYCYKFANYYDIHVHCDSSVAAHA